MKMANLDMRSGATRVTGSGTTLGELDAEYERPSRQSGTTRVSTSTKLPATTKVTPPLVTPLVDIRASVEKALNMILDEQNEQVLSRLSEQERERERERERETERERERERESSSR